MDRYVAANRDNWDDRVPIHLASRFYDVEGWLAAGPAPPAREAALLGDVTGLDLVHLQCHIGTDSIAWAAAGARVTGVDFSGAAIAAARSLAERAGVAERARFVEGDVLDAAALLAPQRFDIVYVSLGSLCWLPSIERWAQQVAALLRPRGRLLLFDVHPQVNALDDRGTALVWSGFEELEPTPDDSDVTYTDGEGRLVHPRSYEWNHSLGEIVTALIARGLTITGLTEHDWSVYPAFDSLVPDPRAEGTWTTPPDVPRRPLSFTLQAEARRATPGPE